MPSSLDGIVGRYIALPDPTHVNISVTVDPSYPYLTQWQNQWGGSSGGTTVPTDMTVIFSTIDEEGIEEDVQANYSATDIPGRAESFQTYMGASNRVLSLTFTFHAQVGDEYASASGSPTDYSPLWVVQQCRFLEQLKQPVYDSATDLAHAPPAVILRIGQLFVGYCILTAGSPRWGGPWVPGSMLPHHAEFPATFMVVRKAPQSPSLNESYATVPPYNRFLEFAGFGEGNY